MWRYSTNLMGPFGLWWYAQNSIPYTTELINSKYTNFKAVEVKNYEKWYGGRIDCYCSDPTDPDYDHYPPELGLPIMSADSYSRFSQWLDDVSTESLVTFEDLRSMFEASEDFTLILFNEKEI